MLILLYQQCHHSVTNNTCSSEGHIPGLTPGGGTTESTLTHFCVSVFSFGGLAEWLGKGLQNPVRQFKSGTHFCGVEEFGVLAAFIGQRIYSECCSVAGSNPASATSRFLVKGVDLATLILL